MPNPTIGYLPCPWCSALHDREALATVRENAKGNLFVVCEGGPDGNQVCCGQGNNLHARHSARLKAMLAKAGRNAPEPHSTVELPDPKPEPETDHGQPAGDPAGPELDPEPKPERRSKFTLL